MSGYTAAVMAVAAVASTAYSVYNGQKQNAAAKKADQKAEAAAQQQNAAIDNQTKALTANSPANKQPNTAAMYTKNQQAEVGGPSGTSLTGPSGVDPSSLMLGKNTLLGA